MLLQTRKRSKTLVEFRVQLLMQDYYGGNCPVVGLVGVIGSFNFLECRTERLFVSTETSALSLLQKLIKALVEAQDQKQR